MPSRPGSPGRSRPSPSTSTPSTPSRTRLNVAALFGHTPLRFYVMGDDATEREATDDEVARMKALLAEGLDAGAIGLSSSRTDSHIGAHGKPVPSRAAALSEIRALAGVLGEKGCGTFESTWGPDLHVEEFADIAREIGRPVSWAALMTVKENPALAADTAARVAAAGGAVHPQVSCRPIVVQIALSDPAPFANVRRLRGDPPPRARRSQRPLRRPGLAGAGLDRTPGALGPEAARGHRRREQGPRRPGRRTDARRAGPGPGHHADGGDGRAGAGREPRDALSHGHDQRRRRPDRRPPRRRALPARAVRRRRPRQPALRRQLRHPPARPLLA